MPEYSGALPFIEHASLVWALPALPFLAALWLGWSSWGGRDRPAEGPDSPGRWVGPLAALGSLLAALSLAYRLGGASGGSRSLLAPGWAVAQIGSLDLSVGLALDSLGATLVIALLLLGGAGQLALALGKPAGYTRLAAASWLTGGAVLAALADGWVTASLGLGLLGLGVALLLEGAAGAGRALAGAVLLALAGGVIFWSLDGSWSTSGFVPEGAPRLVALARGGDASRPNGALTVPELSGARVRLDGSSTVLGVAPFFRLPIPAGLHSVRVDAGPGSDESEVRNFRVQPGGEVGIVVVGPTARFHGLALLAGVKLGDRPLPAFARLTAGPLAPAGLAGLALLLVIGLWCYPGSDRPLDVLLGQLVPLGAVGAVAARGLPLAARSPGWSTGLAAAALLGALALAALARWSRGAGGPVGAASGALVLVAAAALACGAVEAGVVLLVSVLLGAAALLWGAWLVERAAGQPGLEAGEGTSEIAGATALLKVGYALLIGLPPLGGALAIGEVLRVLWGGPGPAAALVLVAVLGLASRAIGRVVYALTEVASGEVLPKNTRKGRPSLPPETEGPAGAAVPVGVGLAVLGAGVGLVGGSTLFAGPLSDWLGTSAVVRSTPAPGSVAAAALLVVGWVAALAAARLARIRFGEARKPGWEHADEAPDGALRLLAGARGAVAAAGAAVASIDERASGALGEEAAR
jgi:hypothetical protein